MFPSWQNYSELVLTHIRGLCYEAAKCIYFRKEKYVDLEFFKQNTSFHLPKNTRQALGNGINESLN